MKIKLYIINEINVSQVVKQKRIRKFLKFNVISYCNAKLLRKMYRISNLVHCRLT